MDKRSAFDMGKTNTLLSLEACGRGVKLRHGLFLYAPFSPATWDLHTPYITYKYKIHCTRLYVCICFSPTSIKRTFGGACHSLQEEVSLHASHRFAYILTYSPKQTNPIQSNFGQATKLNSKPSSVGLSTPSIRLYSLVSISILSIKSVQDNLCTLRSIYENLSHHPQVGTY